MGLLDELRAAQGTIRRGPSCSVAEILKGLSKQDRADLEAALEPESGIGHSTIARVLRARGHNVNPKTIGRHRGFGGDACACHR